MAKRFVLLHGAWHGGWCWEGVVRALTRSGHQALAPTMPGHGPDEDRSRIVFRDYVEAVVRVLKEQPGPVVLVGHSSAGFIIQAAAPSAPERIERLIFHNAFILPDGASQFDLVPPEVAQGMTAAAKGSPDNCVPVDPDFVRGMLMAGDPPEVQEALLARLVPQPLSLFTTKVRTGPFDKLSTPKTVLFCRDDPSLPPGAYLGMAQNLGPHDLIELEGGHETLFVKPKVIASALIQVAGG